MVLRNHRKFKNREAKGLNGNWSRVKVRNQLSNWEKGKRRLYLPQLQKIAQALDVSVDYFMDSNEQEDKILSVNQDNQILIRLINEISVLSYEEQQDVLKYVAFIRWNRIKGGNT